MTSSDSSNYLARFKEHIGLWDLISEKLEVLGLPLTTESYAEVPDCFCTLDHGFIHKPLDDMPSYSWQHVEPLLEQASDLLDRSINDRLEYDEHLVKAFNLYLELKEYYQHHRIHEDEIFNGFYEVEYNETKARHLAEEEKLQACKKALAQVQLDFPGFTRRPLVSKNTLLQTLPAKRLQCGYGASLDCRTSQ